MYYKLFIAVFLIVVLFVGCDSDSENQTATATFNMSATEAVVGSTITFDASPSEGNFVLFEWNFGDGYNGTGKIVQHTYNTAKIHTVILTAHLSSGGTKTYSAQLDIYREGRALKITCQYPGNSEESSIWVIGTYSSMADLKKCRAGIVVAYDCRPHNVKRVNFGIRLRMDFMKYIGYEVYPERKDYTVEHVRTTGEVFFFRFFDSRYPCFQNSFSIMIIEVELLQIGKSNIEFYEPNGIDCKTGANFNLDYGDTDFEIQLSKYYD